MTTRVWNFLLPSTGQHQLRVEQLGSLGQLVFIDGDQQPMREALLFTGPENSLLELRKGSRGQWSLLVNGLTVEDYHEGHRPSGDESLRELRGKPDGSYLISTEFAAANLSSLHVIRIFRFMARGAVHEVQVSHKECIWQVIFDGRVVERAVHKLKDNNSEVSFRLEVDSGQRLDAVLKMTWNSLAMVWRYTLTVQGVEIPLYWSKGKGDIVPAPELCEVLAAEGLPTPSAPPEAELSQVAEDQPVPESVAPTEQLLPQGVSFDALGGSYQATIRSKTGKFVFLGEFTTPEEAHRCYLEALPAHCPDKILAPQVPQ